MSDRNELTASLEDYLETLYHIIEEKQAARAKEIAARLGVQNSSVTGALKNLSKKGFVNYAPYGVITLTDKGDAAARDIIRRHEVMKTFIVDILCMEDNAVADEAACSMEHTVPPEVLERIIRLVEFTQICPRSGREWLAGFKRFCEGRFAEGVCGGNREKCTRPILQPAGKCTMGSESAIPLNTLEQGCKARLVRVEDTGDIGRQLEKMDITPGSVFLVESITPRTRDMDVGVRGYHMTIREHDAAHIMVTPC